MRGLKKWLLEQFLPAWAQDTVCAENRRLRARLERQDQELRELRAYIDGLEAGVSSLRRVVIKNEVKP